MKFSIFDNIFKAKIWNTIICASIYFAIDAPWFLLDVLCTVIAYAMAIMVFVRWNWELFHSFELAFVTKTIEMLEDALGDDDLVCTCKKHDENYIKDIIDILDKNAKEASKDVVFECKMGVAPKI